MCEMKEYVPLIYLRYCKRSSVTLNRQYQNLKLGCRENFPRNKADITQIARPEGYLMWYPVTKSGYPPNGQEYHIQHAYKERGHHTKKTGTSLEQNVQY